MQDSGSRNFGSNPCRAIKLFYIVPKNIKEIITIRVDDVHSSDTGFVRAKERLEKSKISQENKDLILKFM